MKIEIDSHSGFCTGVKRAIKLAEEGLKGGKAIQCLGDIVHNQAEVSRLADSGLNTIGLELIDQFKDSDVLIRAHGEPPTTYQKLEHNQNRIIDGTCPVVIRVQNKLKKAYTELQQNGGTIIIYGKYNHPEVIGLLGQINGDAKTVVTVEELKDIDFSKPIYLFSQTTMSLEGYARIQDFIKVQMEKHHPPAELPLEVFDTICRQVANRVPQLKEFARKFQVIVFVGGAKSSNGKVLYQACLEVNPKTYFVSETNQVQKEWFTGIETTGICGATSTPLWQMEEIKEYIRTLV